MNITQQLWTAKEWARVKSTGSETVELVHNATNEDKWGPTGQQMDDICRVFPRKGQEIMEELRWRMKNRDKAWRACYKSLLVLDYLARNAPEQFLPEICSVVPMLRTISSSFYYTNPKGVDHGISVRERAKNLAELMSDGLLLREEREKAAQTKAKLAHNASDGGGAPSRYGGAYGGSQTHSAYGGSGGGYRYGGQAGGGAARQAYDPYRRQPEPAVPRTKEEQERYDMEMALRMQREEERRAGVSAEQLEAMYARKVEQKKAQQLRQQNAASADEDLARRLQEEEEARARREGKALPQLRSDGAPAPAPAQTAPSAPAAPQAPPQPKQPETNALDDLFAPAPAAPTAGQVPPSAGDPFDAFLTNKTQQQSQWNQPPAPQNEWGQPQNQWTQPPPQSNPWGQPQQPQQPQQAQQANPWGQPPQQQQQQPQQPQSADPWAPSQHSAHADPWGAPQQSPPAPSQPSNQWDPVQKPQPQQARQSSDPWGQPQPPQQWNQSSQPPQQYPGDPWAQPQQPPQQPPQQTSSDPWGQPRQAQQSSDPWGAPAQAPAPASNQPASGALNGQGDAAFANMWASLDKFDNQAGGKR